MTKDVYKKEMSKENGQQSFGRMSARFENRVKPKNIKETITRLLKFSKQEIYRLMLVLAIVLVTSILTLSAPRIIGFIVDQMNEGDFSSSLLNKIGILFVIYALISLLTWMSEVLVVSASQKIIHHMRNTLFKKLSKLPIAYFDSHSHGDIVSRFTNDIDNVSTVMSESTTGLMRSVVTVAGSLSIMLYMNIYLTLGVLMSVPFIYGLSKLIAKRTIQFYKMQQKYTGMINGKVEETVYGLSVIQTFNQEEQFLKNFEEANENLYEQGRKAQLWTGLLMPVLNVINNLTFGVIGLLGGYLVIKGHVTVGVVSSFIAYSRQFVRPLNEMASIYNSLMSAIAGSQRVFQVLDEIEEPIHGDALKDNIISGKIHLNHVHFSYIEGKEVIRDLNVKVEPGMKVAIVGPTGAGKTTVVNLITRFYAPQKGQIFIDDHLIEHIDRHWLRQNIGFVLQDTYLFSGTIYDNILYGDLEASMDDIVSASKIAGAHDFIAKLPHQYHTKLSYGGMNLSQGERQLITIARAILMDPKVLILDEATSSVDIKTEKVISKSLLELMANRTSFIIAHRLSTIVSADLILVMNEGQLIESGTHESLMEEKGFYYEMYQIQTQNQSQIAG
ncbi:MAG: ABC transporter ATP-binding protein [Clostridia bacterium]|nr:ABC transporter ATP-binding protein [Clostridia bacterium]